MVREYYVRDEICICLFQVIIFGLNDPDLVYYDLYKGRLVSKMPWLQFL